MTLYLLDTSTCSDLMRELPAPAEHLARLSAADHPFVCTIVRGEILYGIERLSNGHRRSQLAEKATRLFDALPCDPIPMHAADRYATLKHGQQLKGRTLDENDLWIAATALALEAVLVTRDADFSRVANLTVENWSP
jgi:tRNA(fMet)-specific endonuclease VapC